MKYLFVFLLVGLTLNCFGQTRIGCQGDDCTITSCKDVNGIDVIVEGKDDEDGFYYEEYIVPEGYTGIAKLCVSERVVRVYTYVNGEVVCEREYLEGQLVSKSLFKNGKQYGEYEAYHPNGQLKRREAAGAGNGEEISNKITYHENGQIASKEHVQYGIWEGEQVFFNKKGELIRTLIYKNGEKISCKGEGCDRFY
jgi:antitoxin component YwqK of YwqJK toxin-antitoxin module